MDHTEQLIISTCTGMRGLERGIAYWCPVRAVVHVEIEAFAVENLAQQMEQGLVAPAPIWTDIKTFNGRPFRGKVHGITGGYPCQPFSVAGKRGGGEDPRHLWPYYTRLIDAVRPVWCFFENVYGHLSLGYDVVRGDLYRLGYQVAEGIFSAEEVGAPHLRKRLFILAVDNTRIDGLRQEYRLQAGRDGAQPAGEGELGDATGERKRKQADQANAQPNEGRARGEFGNTSQLADSNDGRDDSGSEEDAGAGQTVEGAQYRQEWDEKERERMRSKFGNGGQLADGGRPGLQGHAGYEHGAGGARVGQGGSAAQGSVLRWPAGRGQAQYEWEPPRVESRVGYVLAGHNFREDLLRMAGNAVVEQQAAYAWVTLWNQILNR